MIVSELCEKGSLKDYLPSSAANGVCTRFFFGVHRVHYYHMIRNTAAFGNGTMLFAVHPSCVALHTWAPHVQTDHHAVMHVIRACQTYRPSCRVDGNTRPCGTSYCPPLVFTQLH